VNCGNSPVSTLPASHRSRQTSSCSRRIYEDNARHIVRLLLQQHAGSDEGGCQTSDERTHLSSDVTNT
jgi:hypothetical protein